MTIPSLLQFTVHGNSCLSSILFRFTRLSVLADLLLSLFAWQLACEQDMIGFLLYTMTLVPWNLCSCLPVTSRDVCTWKSLLQSFPEENCLSGEFPLVINSFSLVYPGITMVRHREASGTKKGESLAEIAYLPCSCSLLAFLALIVWWHWCTRDFKKQKKTKGETWLQSRSFCWHPLKKWSGFL